MKKGGTRYALNVFGACHDSFTTTREMTYGERLAQRYYYTSFVIFCTIDLIEVECRPIY